MMFFAAIACVAIVICLAGLLVLYEAAEWQYTGAAERANKRPPPELFLRNIFNVQTNETLPAPVVTYTDIPGRTEYTSRDPRTRLNQHIGQRKLFLSELQFMTRHVGIDHPGLVVYAGGAPSNKIAFLANLFPKAVFLLVDPNPFNVFPPSWYDRDSPYGDSAELPRYIIRRSESNGLTREKIDLSLGEVFAKLQNIISLSETPLNKDPRERIFIINTIYTPEHSIAIRHAINKMSSQPAPDVYFFSDIRTNIREEIFPRDIDITWNMAQQYIWSSLLVPAATMMKWRRCFYLSEDESLYIWDKLGTNELGAPTISSDGHPASRPRYQAPTSRKLADIPKFVRDDFDISRQGIYIDSTGAEHRFLGVDFLADYATQTLRYPNGVVYIQPYAGMVSAETRLVFTKDAPVITHPSPDEYDGKLFFYNTQMRPGPRYVSAISQETTSQARRLHLDNCNDCAVESLIFQEYLIAREASHVYTLSNIISESDSMPRKICAMMRLLVAATGNRQLHIKASIKTYPARNVTE